MGGEMRTTGSTTSRFWKCNAPKSLRLPHRHTVPSEYADKQLATVQKRIWLIEFLRLRLVIVYQGAPTPTKINTHPVGCVYYFWRMIMCLNHFSWNSVFCSISASVGFCPSGATINLSSLSFVLRIIA